MRLRRDFTRSGKFEWGATRAASRIGGVVLRLQGRGMGRVIEAVIGVAKYLELSYAAKSTLYNFSSVA